MIWNIRKKKTTKQNNKKKKRIQKNKDSVSSLRDNFKHSNIHHHRWARRRRERARTGNLFEKIMKEHFPNFMKEIDMQIQEAQRVPNKMDARGPL